jgi:DNA-binding CsgD family transcriptional regulator
MPRPAATDAALAFLEAAYAWESDVEPWLRALVDAVVAVWGRPRWACAYEYDVSRGDRLDMGACHFWNTTTAMKDRIVDRIVQRGPQTAGLYRTAAVGYSRPIGGTDEADSRMLSMTGTVDYFGFNGLDGGGKGCFVGIGAERATLTASEMILFPRLAAHLSSAYRCRSRLRAAGNDPLADAEALLGHDGRLLETRAGASEASARNALVASGQHIARLRRDGRGLEPTAAWRPRVATRWTFVEAYDRRGERYIVARENQAPAPGLVSLTEREQQVVASAATGKTNKEIAYELGISASTTRVLLSRAYARLGISSRKQLFQLPSVRALRGEPDNH